MVGLQKTSGSRCLTRVDAIPKVKEPERLHAVVVLMYLECKSHELLLNAEPNSD